MNTVFKIFLSMSFSGGLLIAVLFSGKQFLKNKISRQWQYYIWLIVILRLLLPFGPETNLLGKAYQAVDQTITQSSPPPQYQIPLNTPENAPVPVVDSEQNKKNTNSPAEDFTATHPLQDIGALLTEHIWLVWLMAALGLLIRKVTIYQGFLQYIQAGMAPVSDIALLDRLSVAAQQAGVKKPIELCVNPLISSPLLIGFFHPCIVLPGAEYAEKDFQYIALHELTHYKRLDIFYKWLVQVTVCLHWFNPFVYLMSREITKACEFSCDEAVLAKMGYDNAQDYGTTLLNAMAEVGKYKENLGAVTLSENKKILKERLGAIMRFKEPSKAVRLLTGTLTLCVIFGAAFIGTYSIAAADTPNSANDGPNSANMETLSPSQPDHFSSPKETEEDIPNQAGGESLSEIARYYADGSLPLFEIAFSRLDESAQKAWLEKLYADDDIAFFHAALSGLGANSSLPADFAEKAYTDEEISFFSILADRMEEAELDSWLDRALEDGKWNFQSVLFGKLGQSGEFDELKSKQEKEWAETQKAEYQTVGITMNGKNYYYQGELVNIFLDIRANQSFYTLDMNPAGTVNVKIIRDTNDKITDAVSMTDEEVTHLLNGMEDDSDWPDDTDNIDDWLDDMNSDDDWRNYMNKVDDGRKASGGRVWHPQVFPVNLENVADGEIIWLGEYTLSEGDRIWYYVFAEAGNGLQVGFARPDDEFLNTTYYSVQTLRQESETQKCECIASFTFRPPVEPGTYKLFLRATDGDLENVKGSISIGYEADVS